MLLTRKASIGLTISWFAALFIVMLIMACFSVASIYIAGETKIPIIGKGGNEIYLNEDFYSGELEDILETYVKIKGDFMSVEDLVLLWNFDKEKYEDVLEEEIKKVLSGFDQEYIDTKTDELWVRGFGVVIYLNDSRKDIYSGGFNPGYCVGKPCKILASKPIFISSSEKIKIDLIASERDKDGR